ncbi:MAG: DUF3006 domain-containing protein [Clostridiales bacterium]|nr:DUF3006 domain-containing protein [Clostridiales bacterium]
MLERHDIMKYYTLNRIEDNATAVLIDDSGEKTDIPADKIPGNREIGNVYIFQNEKIIYDAKETEIRRRRIGEKKRVLFEKLK